MRIIDKVALLYVKDKQILSSRSKGKDTYYIPGGKREGNETDLETLTREIKEELSVDILQDTASFYGYFQAQAHGHAEGILVKMTCYMAEFEGELQAANEIEEIRWLKYEDARISSPVDQIIFEDLHTKGYL